MFHAVQDILNALMGVVTHTLCKKKVLSIFPCTRFSWMRIYEMNYELGGRVDGQSWPTLLKNVVVRSA